MVFDLIKKEYIEESANSNLSFFKKVALFLIKLIKRKKSFL